MALKKFASKAIRKSASIISRLSGKRILNIDSKGAGASSTLSNFTRSPFVLDGVKWESFEGFWQGIKFPEGNEKRKIAQQLHGTEAKKISQGIQSTHLFYGGKKIDFGSNELYALAKRAERQRFLQNQEQLKALLSTRNARLIYIVSMQDSKSLPRKVFCKILMELREEFQKN